MYSSYNIAVCNDMCQFDSEKVPLIRRCGSVWQLWLLLLLLLLCPLIIRTTLQLAIATACSVIDIVNVWSMCHSWKKLSFYPSQAFYKSWTRDYYLVYIPLQLAYSFFLQLHYYLHTVMVLIVWHNLWPVSLFIKCCGVTQQHNITSSTSYRRMICNFAARAAWWSFAFSRQ